MIRSLLFTLQSLLLALCVIIILGLNIRGKTLEHRLLSLFQTSNVIQQTKSKLDVKLSELEIYLESSLEENLSPDTRRSLQMRLEKTLEKLKKSEED